MPTRPTCSWRDLEEEEEVDVEAVEDEDEDVAVDEAAGNTDELWNSLSRKVKVLNVHNSSDEETETDDHPDVFVKRDRREKHFKVRGQRRKANKK